MKLLKVNQARFRPAWIMALLVFTSACSELKAPIQIPEGVDPNNALGIESVLPNSIETGQSPKIVIRGSGFGSNADYITVYIGDFLNDENVLYTYDCTVTHQDTELECIAPSSETAAEHLDVTVEICPEEDNEDVDLPCRSTTLSSYFTYSLPPN